MEANFQRSLDHRSFYFKQEDKKKRTTKGIHSRFHSCSDDAHDVLSL